MTGAGIILFLIVLGLLAVFVMKAIPEARQRIVNSRMVKHPDEILGLQVKFRDKFMSVNHPWEYSREPEVVLADHLPPVDMLSTGVRESYPVP